MNQSPIYCQKCGKEHHSFECRPRTQRCPICGNALDPEGMGCTSVLCHDRRMKLKYAPEKETTGVITQAEIDRQLRAKWHYGVWVDSTIEGRVIKIVPPPKEPHPEKLKRCEICKCYVFFENVHTCDSENNLARGQEYAACPYSRACPEWKRDEHGKDPE